MKTRAALIVGAAVMIATAVLAIPAAAQHTPDANTVLLDAFDGVTQGEEHGTISYAPSLPALGQAVDLDPGDWLKYAVPPWGGQQGTVEAWIYPETYGYSVALFQWYNTNTNPPAGYIGHFNINPDGHLQWGSWGPPWCPSPPPTGSTVIPLEEWTHVAATWSTAGTRLYVNGVLDFSSSCNWAPALSSPTYVYVNGWGGVDHGLMDEFRISNMARSEEEIGAYVVEILNLPPVSDANGPYVGAMDTEIGFDGTASSDPDGDPLVYDWDWGDTTTSSDGGATPTHAYDAAGVYDVCLTVTDPDGQSDTACTLAAVYDPDGGFVTGGGWIYSDPGAYVPDPSLEGKATFGFVSKYKKGATIPTGNTEFQFTTADVNFHSDNYQWLVVTGSDYARFKGIGTINGAGEYKFQIWAGDGVPDTFRIKIWTEDETTGVETVVYDNGFHQALGGGSIIVHTKK